ncbi:toxin ArtA [Escherichia coli]
MKKLSFKEKLEIVRNIIRESLSGNAAFALLVYSLLHSLPIKTFADLFVTILLFIAIIAVVIWLFLIIYVYFCELFRSHWIAAYFHERRSLNNFHRDRVITFEQIAE